MEFILFIHLPIYLKPIFKFCLIAVTCMDVACCKMEQILNNFEKHFQKILYYVIFFNVLAKISCYVEHYLFIYFVFILLEIKNYNFTFIFVPFKKQLFFIFIIFL